MLIARKNLFDSIVNFNGPLMLDYEFNLDKVQAQVTWLSLSIIVRVFAVGSN